MYEKLLLEYAEEILVIEQTLPSGLKGLYFDGIIAIDRNLDEREKVCVLAEEIGHHFTTCGEILNQSETSNRKQEKAARAWGYEKLIPVSDLLKAFDDHLKNRSEIAERLGVTEKYLDEALNYYHSLHGGWRKEGIYWIHFNPFVIYKNLEVSENEKS